MRAQVGNYQLVLPSTQLHKRAVQAPLTMNNGGSGSKEPGSDAYEISQETARKLKQ